MIDFIVQLEEELSQFRLIGCHWEISNRLQFSIRIDKPRITNKSFG